MTQWTCPTCGTINSDIRLRCASCSSPCPGRPLPSSSGPSPPSASVPPDPSDMARAVALANAGRLSEAQTLLATILQRDPNNTQAWLWLASVVADNQKKRACLEAVLRIDNRNQTARNAMLRLAALPDWRSSSTHSSWFPDIGPPDVTAIVPRPNSADDRVPYVRRRRSLHEDPDPTPPAGLRRVAPDTALTHTPQQTSSPSTTQGSAGNVVAAIASFIVPGLGQLAQGRGRDAIAHFLFAIVLWIIFLGWAIHLFSAFDAAHWRAPAA